MTAEKIHDALTLLPADLIAEADKMRARTPKIILWRRYAAMAACLALILFSGLLFRANLLPGFGGAMEESAEAAAAEDHSESASITDSAAQKSTAVPAEEGLCELPTAPVTGGTDTAMTSAADEEASLEDRKAALPTLTVTQGDASCQTMVGSFNWEFDNGDGTSSAICADAAHPLDIADSLPVLDAGEADVRLRFSAEPDSILVWCWQEGEEDAQLLTSEGGILTLNPGACIYQITARWEGSSDFENIVHYSFRANVPVDAEE